MGLGFCFGCWTDRHALELAEYAENKNEEDKIYVDHFVSSAQVIELVEGMNGGGVNEKDSNAVVNGRGEQNVRDRPKPKKPKNKIRYGSDFNGYELKWIKKMGSTDIYIYKYIYIYIYI